MKRKTTEEYVTAAQSVHGGRYTYENVVYVSDRQPVSVTCPQHGDWLVIAGNHLRGMSGCPVCAGNQPMTTKAFITRSRSIHGGRYNYENTNYTRSQIQVAIECREHGVFFQTPNAHLNGQGCPKCAGKGLITTQSFVDLAVSIHGDKYDYSESVYVSSKTPISIRCKKHDYVFKQVYLSHIGQKSGCPVCAGKMLKTTEQFIVEARAVHGDKYDYSKSGYVRNGEPMLIICRKHGEFFQRPSDHIHQKHGCPTCGGIGPSKAQMEIANFLSTRVETIVEHPLAGRMKSDIFLPAHNISVEFHGLMWHSTAYAVDPRKDYKKHVIAKNLGIRTLHIYEDEWEFNADVVKQTLLSAVGLLPKIYARQCEIVSVTKDDANNFYWDNHIQGGVNSRIHVGLRHKGVLVACMGFDILRSARTNKDVRHWELTRYASINTVVGGASRLLAAFLKMGLADRLTSYSDNRLFTGKMYERLGFTLTHVTPPDYFYTQGRPKSGRQHKSRFQKRHLSVMFPGCDIENKTEREICEENGYYQIYDCGKTRWDLQINTSN